MTKITVRETGRRKFEIDYTLNLGGGKRKRRRLKSPFDTKGKSLAWAQKLLEADLATGGEAKAEPPRANPDAPRSFGYWAKRYLAEAESPAKRGGPDRQSTIRNKRLIITTHLAPTFGRKLVNAITDELVESYIIDKTMAGLSPGYVALHIAKLRAVLHLARRRGNAAEKALEIPDVNVQVRRGEVLPQTLSESQTETLFAFFEDQPPWQLALLTLLFRCGLRCGEALALRWSDVDFTKQKLRVERTLSEGEVVPGTKGRRVRSIDLHWEVEEALRRLHVGEPWDWVFPAGKRTNSGPRAYRTVLQALKKPWRSCGFVGDDGRPVEWVTHIGRHSLGRHWAVRGGGLRGLQELLGHADLKTTMVYAHWSSLSTAPLLQQLGRRRLRLIK